MTYPVDLDTFTNPESSDKLNSPDHATQHANINDATENVQTKLGIDSSADTDSIDYKVNTARKYGKSSKKPCI